MIWNFFKDMDNLLSIIEFALIGKLILSAALGALVGAERSHTGKPAGIRTYALVAMGATLFTIISELGFKDATGFDPSRIVSQIVIGIGFIGAGLIMHHGSKVEGLTTAAGLWVVSAVGAAVGLGLYVVAVFTALFALFILWVIGHWEFQRDYRERK